MTKRLQVVLTEEEAKAIKLYADTWDTTISEVLKSAALQHVNQHALCCKKVTSVLQSVEFTADKRAHKNCYGFACRACNHVAMCRTGLYEGFFEIAPQFEPYLAFGVDCPQTPVELPEQHGSEKGRIVKQPVLN